MRKASFPLLVLAQLILLPVFAMDESTTAVHDENVTVHADNFGSILSAFDLAYAWRCANILTLDKASKFTLCTAADNLPSPFNLIAKIAKIPVSLKWLDDLTTETLMHSLNDFDHGNISTFEGLAASNGDEANDRI